jgi:Rps23 Pro-64 3,4-dihydroxylase Tpa1-like proline 4-hydroxylase
MINIFNMIRSFDKFKGNVPFDHCVVDEFLTAETLAGVSDEFLSPDSLKWFRYNNAIEDKMALNDWNSFPKTTYDLFSYMTSPEFVGALSDLTGTRLYADPGLHGGGWHCHGTGGNLNPHLDYSIHPKLGLQRKLNIIVYVSDDLKEEHGGHLGLYKRDNTLVKEVVPKYNRAVIFDTSQDSWHGMSRPLTQPEGIYRKSLAVYYLCDPEPNCDPRMRALFAPREDQKNDSEVLRLIESRAKL